MLDKLDRQIDAVVISAPNHIHAPASILAMRMGKHVYCEKPLTHSVAEARVMTRLAKQTGLATQMGTQIHASENFRRIVELIRSGGIGNVNSVHFDLASVAPKPWLPKSIGHHSEWVQACKHGGKTSCNFDYAGALSECVLLGNVAFRTEKQLHWKPDSLSIPNVPQAEALLRREYREGW
jgi:hypothetical protein